MTRFLTPAWRGIYWSVFSSLNFALMGVITKASAQHFPFSSNELATWRNLPATLALGGFALLRGQRFATQHLHAHVVRSVSGGVSTLLFFYTITLLPLATAVTLGYSSAIFLALLSFILLHEHITHRTVAVLIIGLIGVAVLLRPGFSAGQAWGLSCGLFGAAMTGLAHLQLREMSATGEPAWRIVFYFSLVSTLMSAAIATAQGWHAPPLAALPYLLGIGAAGLVAQLALTRAYAVGQKFTVAALSYLTVVFSVVFGHYFFHEILGGQEMAGIAIIITAGLISVTRERH
ncbi:DMT family transporter [uncultured Cardiobacterium sp.]|uniref:DMT family transporter n=1 Tax=uncultured Cardiobacterium sp. TaxID=417619 RepID=UPI002628D6DD|nr:DMT family transporter [uncultured Cardiobacterium sp.]